MAKSDKIAKSSKAVGQLIEGSYYDNIVAFLRYGSKVELCAAHKEIFRRIERAEKLWLHHKDDRMVVKLLMRELKDENNKPVSQAQAYNYLNDAKSLFVLMDSFDEVAELLILKQRINKAFELAMNDGKNYNKLYSAAMMAQSEWIRDMRLAKERIKPESQKTITNIYHNDWRELVDEPTMLSWRLEIDVIKKQAKSKYRNEVKAEEVTHVEYTRK